MLIHWGRVTHICVGKQIIIGSGLSPGRRQAIIWTNAGILLIGPLGTNFSENLIRIQTSSFNKMHLKMSFAKWHSFCLGLNVLRVNGFRWTCPITTRFFFYLRTGRSRIRWYSTELGPWFNIKMSSYWYRKFHCGDKTVVRSSYLHNGISYTGKMTSLYWIRAQTLIMFNCQ